MERRDIRGDYSSREKPLGICVAFLTPSPTLEITHLFSSIDSASSHYAIHFDVSLAYFLSSCRSIDRLRFRTMLDCINLIFTSQGTVATSGLVYASISPSRIHESTSLLELLGHVQQPDLFIRSDLSECSGNWFSFVTTFKKDNAWVESRQNKLQAKVKKRAERKVSFSLRSFPFAVLFGVVEP